MVYIVAFREGVVKNGSENGVRDLEKLRFGRRKERKKMKMEM